MSDLTLTHFHIDTSEVRLHVESAGAGTRTLVFLHYWGGSTRTWRPLVERLVPGHRCVALDHRGWGGSSAPPSGYSTADLARDASAVIAALELDDYILVGHSMGGKVAQRVAGDRPGGLAGLVLVAPAPARPAPIPAPVRQQIAGAYLSREAVLEALAATLAHRPLPAPLIEQVVADSLAGAPAAKAEWPERTILEDISAAAERIEVPTLVLAGEHDRVEPPALLASHVVAIISGARLEVIPDAGHLLPLEAPAELAAAISGFAAATTGARLSESRAGTRG